MDQTGFKAGINIEFVYMHRLKLCMDQHSQLEYGI